MSAILPVMGHVLTELVVKIDRHGPYPAFEDSLKERVIRDHDRFTPANLKDRENQVQIHHPAFHIITRNLNFVANRKWLENDEDESAHEVTEHTPHRDKADRDQAQDRT